MAVRLVYRQFSQVKRHALAVGISHWGVHVVEVDFVGECLGSSSPGPFLARKAVFSWEGFRRRERCYSGDDGSGSMKHRLVAGAISLIARYGGDAEWLDDLRKMALP